MAKAVYYKGQLDRMNATMDSKASAFWLERHEEEFRAPASGNQVNVAVVNGRSAEIALGPEQLQRLSDAYDEEMKGK